MKKILYLDPFSSHGHINFNKIYIDALKNQKVVLDFAFKEGYAMNLGVNERCYDIPGKFFLKGNNGWKNRISQIRMLIFLNRELKFKKYDMVMLAAFDEIALFFSFISANFVLVNHNNLVGLDSFVKRFFYKLVSKDNIQIVFEHFMKEYLFSLGIRNVMEIKHGFLEKFDENILVENDFINGLNLTRFRRVIFAPSSSSGDKSFFIDLVTDLNIQKSLEDLGILLILKGDFDVRQNANIKVIKDYLTENQYRYLFVHSHIILIKYNNSFQYRTSGVLWECVANNKLLLLSRIEVFKHFQKFVRFDPFFNGKDDFIDKVLELDELNEDLTENPFINKDKLRPNFEELLISN